MHYFYMKQVFGSGEFKIYSAPRYLEGKPVAWPYAAMYCEQDTFFHDLMQWLEEHAQGFVISEMRSHRGGKLFGGPNYEIWIEDDDPAMQFKLTFC